MDKDQILFDESDTIDAATVAVAVHDAVTNMADSFRADTEEPDGKTQADDKSSAPIAALEDASFFDETASMSAQAINAAAAFFDETDAIDAKAVLEAADAQGPGEASDGRTGKITFLEPGMAAALSGSDESDGSDDSDDMDGGAEEPGETGETGKIVFTDSPRPAAGAHEDADDEDDEDDSDAFGSEAGDRSDIDDEDDEVDEDEPDIDDEDRHAGPHARYGYEADDLDDIDDIDTDDREDRYPYNADEDEDDDDDEYDDRGAGGFIGWIRGLTFIDYAIGIGAVAVAAAVILFASRYMQIRHTDEQRADFRSIGAQLSEIDFIENGKIQAIADAKQQRDIAAAQAEELKKEEEQIISLAGTIPVTLDLSSVQKDLKIKFHMGDSGTLLTGVPFTALVTSPSGSVETYTDTDMDGMIYETDMTAGEYQVAMQPLLTEEMKKDVRSEEFRKYAKYLLPSEAQRVTVKDKIEYKKVEVADEIKQESQINVAQEDTARNDTVVESVIQDTVEWVDSTKTEEAAAGGEISDDYEEVSKDEITDPYRNVQARANVITGNFRLLAEITSASENTDDGVQSVGNTLNGSLEINDEITDPETGEKVSKPATDESQGSEGQNSEGQNTGTGGLSSEGFGDIGGGASHEITTGDFGDTGNSGNTGDFGDTGSTGTDQNQGTGTSTGEQTGQQTGTEQSGQTGQTQQGTGDQTGTGQSGQTGQGTGTGQTQQGTTQNQQGQGQTQEQAAVTLKVSPESITLAPDKTQTIEAIVENSDNKKVTFQSENELIARFTQTEDTRATVEGISIGETRIFVYTEADPSIEKIVTVKVEKSEDAAAFDENAKLRDNYGNQLYVQENGQLREAIIADYNKFDKFYRKKSNAVTASNTSYRYTGWQNINGLTYYFDKNGVPVTGQQVIQGATYNFNSEGVLASGNTQVGIDVSGWNGSINWPVVAGSGINFAIVRAGYRGSSVGALVEDSKAAYNIQNARAAGLKVGIYIFSQAVNEAEAVYEASMAVDFARKYGVSMPIFIDVESSGGRGDAISVAQRTANIIAFCKTVQASGYSAGIYANTNWFSEKIDVSQLTSYHIWLAQYSAAPTYTRSRYDIWQYSNKGKVNGISGSVDMNISYRAY